MVRVFHLTVIFAFVAVAPASTVGRQPQGHDNRGDDEAQGVLQGYRGCGGGMGEGIFVRGHRLRLVGECTVMSKTDAQTLSMGLFYSFECRAL